MVDRFDEINQENIADMSLEDLQKLALSGKDELVNSRKVIWDLNKKIKKPADDDWEENKGMSREEMDEYYNQKRKEESFSDFLNKNNLDEDQKKKAEDYFAKWLSNEEIARLTWVNSFENNQRKANWMWVWNWTAWKLRRTLWMRCYNLWWLF